MTTTNEASSAVRDELARLISSRHTMAAVDAILAAGYRKPRTITARQEDNGVDEIPPLSVVLSAGKPAIMQCDGTFMDYDGQSWDVWEVTYPLTVLYEPEAEVGA